MATMVAGSSALATTGRTMSVVSLKDTAHSKALSIPRTLLFVYPSQSPYLFAFQMNDISSSVIFLPRQIPLGVSQKIADGLRNTEHFKQVFYRACYTNPYLHITFYQQWLMVKEDKRQFETYEQGHFAQCNLLSHLKSKFSVIIFVEFTFAGKTNKISMIKNEELFFPWKGIISVHCLSPKGHSHSGHALLLWSLPLPLQHYRCIYFSLSPKATSLMWPQFLAK